MNFAKTLSRSEMKNIKAGRMAGGCKWKGCGKLTMYYGCLKTKCSDWYGGSSEWTNCVKTVNSMEEGMIGACGVAYQ